VDQKVDPKNLHIHTEYDNVPTKDLPKIRAWLLDQGKAFHRRAREYLSRFDRDVSRTSSESDSGSGRVIVTAFSWTEVSDTDQHSPGV
jgi:hypothetical protein